jgi:hypothetical protein
MALAFHSAPSWGGPLVLGTTNLADINEQGDLIGNLQWGNQGGFLLQSNSSLHKVRGGIAAPGNRFRGPS